MYECLCVRVFVCTCEYECLCVHGCIWATSTRSTTLKAMKVKDYTMEILKDLQSAKPDGEHSTSTTYVQGCFKKYNSTS